MGEEGEAGPPSDHATTRVAVVRLAWPIVLANSAVPLLGLADTAVIGNTGEVTDLGAIALGAVVFSFVYWSFGFLRMGTTGFVAQASGAGDEAEVRATLGRALLIAGVVGVSLFALQLPIAWIALRLLSASVETEALTRAYFDIRIWGAPATLGTFAILGTFVGLGRTRQVLATQLLLNGLNIGLDVLFAGVLEMGVSGIALGTALAEWTTFFVAAWLLYRILAGRHADAEAFWPMTRIMDRGRAVQTIGANADIMVRTLFLLLGFAWFTNEGAAFGDAVLAANHVLLQLITASAYLLDGYAHATEVLIGRAIGARTPRAFDGAIRSATELAAVTGVGLSLLIYLGGPAAIRALTDIEVVREATGEYLPYATAYVLASFAAFQLDGIYIGATWTRPMRNASIASCCVFLAASLGLTPLLGNRGLWIAFIVFVIARATALLLPFGRLRRDTLGRTASSVPPRA